MLAQRVHSSGGPGGPEDRGALKECPTRGLTAAYPGRLFPKGFAGFQRLVLVLLEGVEEAFVGLHRTQPRILNPGEQNTLLQGREVGSV